MNLLNLLLLTCTLAILVSAHGINELPPSQDEILANHAQTREVSKKCGRSVCTLTPELVEGPYYIALELIRYDLVESLSSTGIPMYMNFTIIDVTTCQPVPNAGVDIWHANATGVYSHIQVTGNNGGLTTTFLRGIQITDSNGQTSLKSIIPGWYQGRAIHTHVKVHVGGTAVNSSYYSPGNVVHDGQLFFNQSFMDSYATVSPYSTNTQSRLSLSDDMWYPYSGTTGLWSVQYVDSSKGVSAGIYVSTTIAINTTATNAGVVVTTSSGNNGGGPGGNGNGGPNSGSATTTAVSTTSTGTGSSSTTAKTTSSGTSNYASLSFLVLLCTVLYILL